MTRRRVGPGVGRLQGIYRSIAAGTMALINSRPGDANTLFEIDSVTDIFTGMLLADTVNHAPDRSQSVTG